MNPSRPQNQSAQPEHEPVDTSSTGRDAKGRFTKSNPGGPGNPYARQVAKLRSALVNTVTEEDMQCIAKELTLQATRGNLAAIKLLFLYVLGKPTETVNPETLDREEWQQIVQPIPQIMKELPEALISLPVETANGIVDFMQQAVRETLELPQQAFEKVVNTIATDELERQESPEDEQGAALPEEEAPSTNRERKPTEAVTDPSTNRERKPTEAVTDPSTNGHFGRARSLLWLAKIAATARLAEEKTRNGHHRGG